MSNKIFNEEQEEISKTRLKQTMIALSVINDMPAPQRLYEIKELVKSQEWDKEDFILRIGTLISQINNKKLNKKIQLRHVESVKRFPEKSNDYEGEFRVYHEFKNIDEQIAIAYLIHTPEFLRNIKENFTSSSSKLRKMHNLDKETRNYGNISYNVKPYTCIKDEEKDIQDDMFFPYYYDWQEQWSSFVHSFDFLNKDLIQEEELLVLKIDFKNSYDELNPKEIEKWLNPETKDAFLHVDTGMKSLFELSQKYTCEDEGCNVDEKIPYGGQVESHILANFLILNKMHKILNSIEKRKFKIIKYVRYADDIAIFIKTNTEDIKTQYSFEAISEKLSSSKGGTQKKRNQSMRDELEKIIESKVIKETKINKNKTEWHFIRKDSIDRDVILLKDSYSSVSSVRALKMPEFLSDNYFNLEKYEDKTESSRTYRNLEVMEFIEDFNKWTFMPSKINHLEINKMKKKKNFMSYFIPIYKKSENIKHKKRMLIWLLDNESFFSRNEQIIIDKDEVKKRFYKAWYINIKGWFIKYDLEEDLEIIKEINFLKDSNIEDYYIKDKIEYIKKCEFKNNIYQYIEEQGEIRKDLSLFAHSQLVKLIKDISKKDGCDYHEIKNKYIFYKLLIIEKQELRVIFPEFWKSIKTNLIIYFNELYGNKPDMLYWRFKYLITSAETRIDFIKACKYLNKTIKKLADLNSLKLSAVDIEYFELIKTNYLAYSTLDSYVQHNAKEMKSKEIDVLWQIRIICKILWKNGSFSTQTYTSHNEEHGDILLLRFIELRRSIKEARFLINKNNFSIFAIIGSMYTHDLGMLFNGDVSALYTGDMKTIYNEISGKVRNYHGRNSASIINEWLARYLGIDSKHVVELSNAAIGHEIGVDSLSPLSLVSKNNALIISILDLLDITYERSNLLSRKLSGTIASEETFIHWIKHYCTKNIMSYEYNENQFIINISANLILFKYKRDAIKFLEPIIKADLVKWLPSNINKLLKNNTFSGKKVDVKINISWTKEYPQNIDLEFYRATKSFKELELINIIKKRARHINKH